MAPSLFSWAPTAFASRIKNPLLYFHNSIQAGGSPDSSSSAPISAPGSLSGSGSGFDSSSNFGSNSGSVSGSGSGSGSGFDSNSSSNSNFGSNSGSGSGSGSALLLPSSAASVPDDSSTAKAQSFSEMEEGLRFIFDHFDENRDGQLSADELHKSLRMLGIDADGDEVLSALLLDPPVSNGSSDRALDFDDFVAFYYNLNQGMEATTSASTKTKTRKMKTKKRIEEVESNGLPTSELDDAGAGSDLSAVRSIRSADPIAARIGDDDQSTAARIGDDNHIATASSSSAHVEDGEEEEEEEDDDDDDDDDEDDEEEEDLRNAFDLFDKNGNGFICAQELQSVLNSMGLKQGKLLVDCQNMIRTFDLNGDGQISFDEFKHMMAAGFDR